MGNKSVYLLSPLIIENKVSKAEYQKFKALAGAIDFPTEKQKDLLYFKAVFVSSGTNKNAVTFLPSELIKARNSIAQKAVDLEHKENEVVGHIYSYSFLTTEGTEIPLDSLSLDKSIAGNIDETPMDIVVAGVIYKARFPELAQEVNDKKWFISMEAYFETFDLKVGSIILPLESAKSLGLSENSVGKTVKAKFSKSDREYHRCLVSRVLRNIIFSGSGIVKEPANPNSLFIETASDSILETQPKEPEISIDFTSMSGTIEDNVTAGGGKMADNKIVLEKYEQDALYVILKIDETKEDSPKVTIINSGSSYFDSMKESINLAATEKDESIKYAVVSYLTCLSMAPTKLSISDILKDNDVTSIFEVDEEGSVVNTKRVSKDPFVSENAALYINYTNMPVTWTTPPSVDIAPRMRTITEGICVSFKNKVYEYNGASDQGKIIHEHWCNLFNEACPVLGAVAKDKKCLRNTRNQLTKEVEDTTMVGENVRSETASIPKDKMEVLRTAISKAKELINKCGIEFAVWTRKFINDLPNSSFAACESDVKDNKNSRHLPHHGMGGGGTSNVNLDLPHLRNALARANQVKPVGKISAGALKKKCMNHLNKHRGALKSASEKSTDDESKKLIAEIEYLYVIRNEEVFGDKK